MNKAEQICAKLRHSRRLGHAAWLWDGVRPLYNEVVCVLGRNGLERVINGTDSVRVSPPFRCVAETYEPEVWKRLMADVRLGDRIADVGAFIGLYSIALAKRIGTTGHVTAFEPDQENFAALEAHCRLNGITDRVSLIHGAVADVDGAAAFEAGRSSESRLGVIGQNGKAIIPCTRLDTAFANSRVDLLKIDVEGWEEPVLKGGMALLQDQRRKPRVIYIEVHPFAWHMVGTSSDSLLDLLTACDYQVTNLEGRPVTQIEAYGEIVASGPVVNSMTARA
jgi:FkbM family methyltransferase